MTMALGDTVTVIPHVTTTIPQVTPALVALVLAALDLAALALVDLALEALELMTIPVMMANIAMELHVQFKTLSMVQTLIFQEITLAMP